jgi:hypothetical protein
MDHNYLQQSPHLRHISSLHSSRGPEDHLVRAYGTFNFQSTDEYREAKEFLEQLYQRETEDRRIEIQEETQQDVAHYQQRRQVSRVPTSTAAGGSPLSPFDLFSCQQNLTQTLLQLNAPATSLDSQHRLLQQQDKETIVTEREGKVSETIALSSSRQSSILTVSHHEHTVVATTNLALVLMSTIGTSEDTILIEGERKLRKDLRELEKERKTEKTRADIKASDLFRDHDKDLKLGLRRGAHLSLVEDEEGDDDAVVQEILRTRQRSKVWRNHVYLLPWFWCVGVLAAYLYCLGTVMASRHQLADGEQVLSLEMLSHPLDSFKYWAIVQLKCVPPLSSPPTLTRLN